MMSPYESARPSRTRTSLQIRAGLLIAHDEFTKTRAFVTYRARLTGKHVFGKANEPADMASRSKNAEAERLSRFLGLEPRWLPLRSGGLFPAWLVLSKRQTSIPQTNVQDGAGRLGKRPISERR